MVIISIAYVLKISLISSFRNCMLLLGRVVSCLFDRVYSLGVLDLLPQGSESIQPITGGGGGARLVRAMACPHTNTNGPAIRTSVVFDTPISLQISPEVA